MTISLCMIVKNEESILRRCLNSVADAVDEIIIVDTGSTDATRDIAAEFTDKVLEFTWIEDFSAARNFAFDQATMDYQMWLDADDVLRPEERNKLIALKEVLSPNTDMVTMRYNTNFDENGNPILTSIRERLLKRTSGFRWQDPVHECIPLSGSIYPSDITIDHRKEKQEGVSYRNLRIYEALENSGKSLTPRQLYYFARELRDHGQLPKAVFYFEKFLNTEQGWEEDIIATCHALGIIYRVLGEEEKSINILLRAFRYSGPRAEICSEIAYYFKIKGRYKEAIAWFSTAANLIQPDFVGFLLRDYWGYIPNIEMCVCYYQLGDIEKAEHYNHLAGTFKKGSKAVMDNEALFTLQKQAV